MCTCRPLCLQAGSQTALLSLTQPQPFVLAEVLVVVVKRLPVYLAGKLSVSIQGHDGGLNALVLQDSPRTVFNITNWQQLLRQGLPSDVRSGAVVAVTGSR